MLDLFAATWMAPEQYELRPDAKRFENWENNYAGRLGLGAAADYALTIGMQPIWQRIDVLATRLRSGLADIGSVQSRDIGAERCGIVTFTVGDLSSAAVKDELAARGINVSVSGPSSTLIDALRRDLPPIVRASVHYYNSEEEVDTLLNVLSDIAPKEG